MADEASPTAQLQSEITALQRAIEALAALPDSQRLLKAQLAEKEQRLAAIQLQSGGVNFGSASIDQMGDAVGGDKIGGDKVLGDKHEHHYGASDTPDVNTLLREYLGSLDGACNRLSLADADSSDPMRAAVELAAVFTRLEVATTVDLTDEERRRSPGAQQRQRTAVEAVGAHPRLVLLGEPGSGKSTVANFLGLAMAHAFLGEAGWLEQLGAGWALRPLLPIHIALREFAAWLIGLDQCPLHGDVSLLWSWLKQTSRNPVLVAQLRQEIVSGCALVLLDGLDEVPLGDGQHTIRLIREVIVGLSAVAGACCVLVTCRALDYQQSQRQLAGWHTERLIPFSDMLRHEFIGRWYDVLARLDRPLNGEPAVLCERLRSEVRSRPDLRRLAGNPLLLTMMTLLHAYEGRLPEERVRLYEKCVEFLLHRWRAKRGETPLRAVLGLEQWSESDLGRLLDRLGFAAHTRGVSGDGEAGADLPRAVLIETARAFFAAYDPEHDYSRAEAFGRYLSRYSNGLLQQFGPGIYRFPHRTFQEYLAARRLVTDDGWDDAEAEFVERALLRAGEGPQWREALLLAASRLVVLNNQTRPAADLAEALLDQHPERTPAWSRNATLAGEILHEVGRERLTRLGKRRSALWERVVAALVVVLEHEDGAGQPLLPSAERVRAGQALGLLGDPRPGVAIQEPDWCEVPAGPFLMGSGDQDMDAGDAEKPQRTVELPDFRISRYPVTNAQWHAFVEAGGYRERRWWSDGGWEIKAQAGWKEPGEWDNLRFNGSNQPIVGISWYEASAFCRWLSAELGYAVRLPSEAEWEKAARGANGRIYPWGDEWDAAKANTEESSVGATTPVGCFPRGASPYGVLDMIGNVFEWTITPWTDDYQQSDGTNRETEGGQAFVRRGGAWFSYRWCARCAYRVHSRPSDRYDDLGIRVVAALTLGI